MNENSRITIACIVEKVGRLRKDWLDIRGLGQNQDCRTSKFYVHKILP